MFLGIVFCLFFVSSLFLFVYCQQVSGIGVKYSKMRTKQSFALVLSEWSEGCDLVKCLISLAEKYFKEKKQKEPQRLQRVENMTWLARVPFNPTRPRHLVLSFVQMFVQVATCSILQPTVSYLIVWTLSFYLQKGILEGMHEVRIVFSDHVCGSV